MTKAQIGPVLIEDPNIEPAEDKTTSPESFKMLVPHYQASQLKALATEVKDDDKTELSILRSTNPFGLIPINTSQDLVDNKDMTHRYYGLLSKVEPKYLNPNYAEVEIEAYPVCNLDDYLYMQYTPEEIDHGYDDSTQNFILNETCDTFDTTNVWYPKTTTGMASSNLVASGGAFVFSGAASVDGVWGQNWIQNRVPFLGLQKTIEFDMEWVAKPSVGNYDHSLNFWVSNKRSISSVDWTGSVVIALGVSSTIVYYHAYVIKQDGTWIQIVPVTITTAQKIKCKFESDNYGYFDLSVSEWNGSFWSDWTKKVTHMWTDIQPNWDNLYLGISMNNQDSTSASMKTNYIQIYNYLESVKPCVPCLPVSCTPLISPDAYLASEDGNIPTYNNPAADLHFKVSPTNFFKGGVKALNWNYPDNNPQLVLNTDDVLDPTKFSVSNGLVKLLPTANSVKYQYWNGSSYGDLKEFTIGTINVIQANYISRELFGLQLNDTYWLMESGKRAIKVNHPNTSLTFPKGTCYYHDGTTTTDPADNDNITMQTQFYCNIWNKGTGTCASPNPADRYRLQIIRQNKEDIKSNSIPASELTGISMFDSNINLDAIDGYRFNARAFWMNTNQNIGYKKI